MDVHINYDIFVVSASLLYKERIMNIQKLLDLNIIEEHQNTLTTIQTFHFTDFRRGLIILDKVPLIAENICIDLETDIVYATVGDIKYDLAITEHTYYDILPEDTNPSEFAPNWDNIEGNYLAMDRNGSWYSYEHAPTFHEDIGDWILIVGKLLSQYDINYRHPDPSKALYKRPNC